MDGEQGKFSFGQLLPLSPSPVPVRIIARGGSQMPQQELFFEQQAEDRLISVIKTYDRSYAREVFCNVNEVAMKSLAGSSGNRKET